MTPPTTQQKSFGDLYREYRKSKRIQLGTMATMLNVAPSYLSDVELGRRHPMRADMIRRSAELLELEEHQLDRLLASAAADRGTIELTVNARVPEAVELGATLMREWSHMTPADQSKITNLVRQLKQKQVK